jgi:plasmid stability protein
MAMLQVRNLSEATHHTLKVRAAQKGQSLSDFVAGELDRIAETPTVEEFLATVRAHGSVEPTVSAVDILREERAEHS